MLYILRSKMEQISPYAIIDMEKFNRKYYEFFIEQKGDGKFLNYTTVKFKAQEGYTVDNIEMEDFINCTTPIPIFSEHFVNSVSKYLADDISFYPCIIICEGKIFTFYIGKILKNGSIVNEELSEYRQLRDGSNVIHRIKYNENLTNDEQYIARDQKKTYIYAVSEKFKRLAESKNLNIHFKEV
jgi:hypothetical protein